MAKHNIVYDSVYETALEQADLSALNSDAVRVTEIRDRGFVVLRLRPATAGVSEAMAKLGIELPDALGMTGSADTRLVKWISPDEYLVTLPLAEKDTFITDAKAALEGIFSAVVDNSGGYSLLNIAGSEYQELLSKLTFYDLRGNLPVGKVVSTLMTKAPVIFYRTAEDSLMCMVRWSFADYAWKIMVKAAEEYR
ncbi:MAG: sarcosine oxidase subunit gamma family protein [Thiolinea sp.]